jgi:hypothetical protein
LKPAWQQTAEPGAAQFIDAIRRAGRAENAGGPTEISDLKHGTPPEGTNLDHG